MRRRRLNAKERINGLIDERNRLRSKVFDLEWKLAELQSKRVCYCSIPITSDPVAASHSTSPSLSCESKLSRLKSAHKKEAHIPLVRDHMNIGSKKGSGWTRSCVGNHVNPHCCDSANGMNTEIASVRWANWSKKVTHPNLLENNLGTFSSWKKKPRFSPATIRSPILHSPDRKMMDLDLSEDSTSTLPPTTPSDESAAFPQSSNFHIFPVVDAPKWTNPCSVESVAKVDKFVLHPFYLQDLKFALPIFDPRTPIDSSIKFLWSGGEYTKGQNLVITHTLGTDGTNVWLYESDGLEIQLEPSFLPHELFTTNSYSHYYATSFNRIANLFPVQLFGSGTRYRGLTFEHERFAVSQNREPVTLDQLYSDEVLRTLKFRCYTLLVFPAHPTDCTDLYAEISSGIQRCEVTLCRSAKGNEFQVVVYSIEDLDTLMLNLFHRGLDFCLDGNEENVFASGTRNWYYIGHRTRDEALKVPTADAMGAIILSLTDHHAVNDVHPLMDSHKGTIGFETRLARTKFLRGGCLMTLEDGKKGLKHDDTGIEFQFQTNVARNPSSITEVSWTVNTANIRRIDGKCAHSAFILKDTAGFPVLPWLVIHANNGATSSNHFVFITELEMAMYVDLESKESGRNMKQWGRKGNGNGFALCSSHWWRRRALAVHLRERKSFSLTGLWRYCLS